MLFNKRYELYRRGHRFSPEELNEVTDEKIDMGSNIKDVTGNTFLFWLIRNKDHRVPKFLEKHLYLIDLEVKNNRGWTVLMFAARNTNTFSSIRTIRSLIKAGAKPNTQSPTGSTALSLAARFSSTHSSVATVKILLFAGAYVNTPDGFGCTSLMYAVMCGMVEAVGVLISTGANVNIQDKSERSAIMYAARYVEIIERLIVAGANINAQDTSGWTALMYAITFANTTSPLPLIKASADVNIKNKAGETALSILCTKQERSVSDDSILEALLLAGAEFDDNFSVTLSGYRLKYLLQLEEALDNHRREDFRNLLGF